MRSKAIAGGGIGGAVLTASVLAWCAFTDCQGRENEKMVHKPKALPTPEEIAKLPPDGGREFNRLIHEKSPYLLQHARNPVDWYPWGPEAFAKAKKEGKPIFLSVGYSTCHWCHVMERESFERDDVAKILNEHYVAVKVDREERPDVDQIYMLATQLVTGRGGWPNSLWLTPDGRPWFTGTYFPREDQSGRPGFKSILTNLAKAWRTRRKDINTRADQIAKEMRTYSGGKHVEPAGEVSRDLIQAAVRVLRRSFDEQQGGFGGAPKFPPHSRLRLLVHEYRRTKDPALLRMATRTLDAMADGGIHDHVAGGFHRYAVDDRWFLPHFEKMLYDNAQLARAYVDGYLLTRDERYRDVAVRICEWVLREMSDPAGGFHSALDADSEGEEGKFYLWDRKEIVKLLAREDGELFCDVYGAVDGGNFRDEATGHKPGTSILYLPHPLAEAAGKLKLSPGELSRRLASARAKLLAVRVRRVWPHRDDKVLAAWNALMISSLAYAGQHLGEPRYVVASAKAAEFVLARMRKNGRLLRTYRQGAAKLPAYLDDYAFLADAMLDLRDATDDTRWLAASRSIADEMLRLYRDTSAGGFFFTAGDHEDLLARTKDPLDQAIPAGNAVAARALVRLGQLTGQDKYRHAAGETLDAFQGFMARMPQGTSSLLVAAAMYLDTAPAAPAGPKADAVAGSKPVTVAAFASRLTAPPGAEIDLALRLTVDKGWHVNSRRPLSNDLVATSVSVKAGAPAALGDVVYPPGKKVKFAFSPEALSVYEGTIWIRAKLKLSQTAKPGRTAVEIALAAQPCNDSRCLAPQTHKLTLNLTVAASAKPAARRHPSLFGAAASSTSP